MGRDKGHSIRGKVEKGNRRGDRTYLRTIKPRDPNPSISKHHIPNTDNYRSTPLPPHCRTGDAYQNHKDRHKYRTYEGTPEQYLPSSETFDGCRERVGTKGKHGVHDGGE